MQNTGEIASLLTALFWTITALAFERASLKIGSLSVNIIRLFIGFFFLSIFTWIFRGIAFPTDFDINAWGWLLLSGLIGFVFGDLFLFKSYTIIGSRFSMLIMTLVPPITALVGWLVLREKLSVMNYVGMLLTISGISVAIFSKDKGGSGKLKLKLSIKGVVFAFIGAVGQAVGLVISKLGMKENDPFAATQIRLIAGMIGFVILVTSIGRWKKVFQATKNRQGIVATSIGAFFGPFLGVSFSLLAIQHTQTGIASTIMSIVPILIIPPVIFLYKQKVSLIEIAGTIISILGVSLFFIKL